MAFGDMFGGSSDLLNYIRLQHILNQQQNPAYGSDSADDSTPMQNNQPSAFGSDSADNSPGALPQPAPNNSSLNQFTPSTTARDRLNNLLDNMPKPQKPSIWRRIGAGIVGAGAGPQAGMNFVQGAYPQQMSAWEQQLRGDQSAASDENSANMLGRQLQQNQNQFAYNNRRQDETERANKVKEDEGQQKINIANSRAQAYIFKQSHPNWPVIKEANGNYWFYNPQDPTQKVDSGLNDGTMDDYDKINLGIQGREAVANINQSGENTRAANKASAGAHVSRILTAPDGTAYAVMSDNSVVPLKDLPVGTTGVPTAPTETHVKETETGAQPDVVQSFFGAKAPVKTKETDTIKGANLSGIGGNKSAPNAALRQKAIDRLTTDKKPITEANIQFVMKQMGGS